MSAPQTTTGTGTPAPPVSGNTAQQTQGGSTPVAGSSVAAKPFVPAKFDLPLLNNNSNNYELWSKALTLSLLNRGLWTIVDGTEVTPDPAVDAAAHDEWKIKDQEAQLTILLALKPVAQKSIYHIKTSKECWDRLCTRYSGGDDRRTILLFKQVFLATLKDSEPLQPQLNGIIFAAQQLESVNLAISDRVLAFMIATRLPNSYDTLRTVLTNSHTSNISSKFIVDQILAEEHHRIIQSGGNATAFFAKARKGKPGQGNS